jgi:hypothetical protein
MWSVPPQPVPKWAVASFVLMLAVIVGLLASASRSQHEDRLTAVESVRAIEDGRAVEAVVVTNTCGEPRRLVVEETSTEVEVMALVRWDTNGDCDDIGLEHTLTAELADDLAGRDLIAGRP